MENTVEAQILLQLSMRSLSLVTILEHRDASYPRVSRQVKSCKERVNSTVTKA